MSTNIKKVYLRAIVTKEMINLEEYTYLKVIAQEEDWKPVEENIAEILVDKNKHLEIVESK